MADVADVAAPLEPSCARERVHVARRVLGASRRSSEGRGAEARRVEDELASLRDVYSRQIANTEMRCERLIQAKDDERAEWYRERKVEIKQMAAALVVMKSLFESKRRRLKTQMEEDHADFERHKASFRQETEMLRAEARAQAERAAMELAERSRAFEEKLSEVVRERGVLRERVRDLEASVMERGAEFRALEEESAARQKELEELRRRLLEAQQEAEVARRNSRVEELEAELQRTRRAMQEQAHREADALRRELMEYVRFIVQILPDDWRQRNLPVESWLEDRLSGKDLETAHVAERVGTTLPSLIASEGTESTTRRARHASQTPKRRSFSPKSLR